MKEKPRVNPNLIIASRLQRAVNVIIDVILQYILFRVIVRFIGIIEIIINSMIIYANISLYGLAIIIGFVMTFMYYYFYESRVGKTVAKYVTSTKVVRYDGSKPSKRDIFNRTLYRIIPFEWLTFIFDSKPIGLHDSLSNTVVVKELSDTKTPKAKDFYNFKDKDI